MLNTVIRLTKGMLGLLLIEEDEDAAYPTVRYAVLPSSFKAGEPDGRLTGEQEFGDLIVYQFLGAGCDTIIAEDQTISFAEPGLENLKGKRITKEKDEPVSMKGTFLIIVWNDDPQPVSDEQMDSFMNAGSGLELLFGTGIQ